MVFWLVSSHKCAKMLGRSARYKTPVSKKSPLKTVALAVKLDKLVTEKPGKSKLLEVAKINLRAGGGLHGPKKPR